MTSFRDLEDRPVVVRQDFPADVTLHNDVGAELVHLARVVVTRAALYVWTAPGEPIVAELYTDVALAGTFDPPSTPSTVTTPHGMVSWVPGQGCGCSHPLKHYRPFHPTRLG